MTKNFSNRIAFYLNFGLSSVDNTGLKFNSEVQPRAKEWLAFKIPMVMTFEVLFLVDKTYSTLKS